MTILEKLKVGDVVIVSTVLTGEREYPVKRIDGNRAITDFRTFNVKIYPLGYVYEFRNKQTSNTYRVKG